MNFWQSEDFLRKIIAGAISLLLIGTGGLLADQSGFDGYWRSTFGHIALKTNGSQVSGTYSNGKAKGKMVGTLSPKGHLLVGKWIEDSGSGKFVFKLQDGSNSFIGKWGKKGELLNGRWNGVREKEDARFVQAKPSDFVGEWNTNFGTFILDEDENGQITGVFSGKVNNGTVSAQFDSANGELIAEWTDEKNRGKATFQLLKGKNGLYGEWWYQNEQYGGAWIGVRAASAVGCVDGNCEDGDGVYVWTDGSRYEGHWRKGAPHGVGLAYNSDAQLEKNGLWLNGVYQAKILSGNLAEGNGKIKFTNSDIYVGQFKELVPSGNGKIIYRNGNIYNGEVLNGKPNGYGSFIEKESGDRYKGVFRRGVPHGTGVLEFASGQKYEGQFRQGKPYGNGVMAWIDGSRYEGEWRKGKPSGTGVFYYANGDQYTGSLGNGLKDGRGTYIFANGDTVRGAWQHDQIATVQEERRIAQTAENAQSSVDKHAYFENNPQPEVTTLFQSQNRAYLVYQMQEKKIPFINPYPISSMVGDNKELHLTYFVVHGADTLSEASVRSFIAEMTKTNVDDFKMAQIVNNRNDVNKTINQYRFGLHKARIYISGGEHFYYSEDRFALTQ